MAVHTQVCILMLPAYLGTNTWGRRGPTSKRGEAEPSLGSVKSSVDLEGNLERKVAMCLQDLNIRPLC